jgi:choline dehydrogenase-like flavoprotein
MATDVNDYDFIIIGGGTSGLVVAARLTENPALSVLVLEAGENYLQDPRVGMPAGWGALLETEADWDFKTVSQVGLRRITAMVNLTFVYQAGLSDRSISLPQGRALGGSSAINAAAFIMPSQFDFDSWAQMGNSGWDWASLEPYFQKFQTLNVPSHPGNDFARNYPHPQATSGPIQACFPELEQPSILGAWNETFSNLGHGFRGDVARGKMLGPYSNPASIDPVTAQRSYSASAYLQPVMGRANINVLTGALVVKIRFLGQSPAAVATGVNFVHRGKAHVATARKEVILAAGALQSPTILELSGIGKATLLKSHGIPITHENLYVGENLQDHIHSGISYEVADGISTLDDLARGVPAALQAAFTAYSTTRSGPFSHASVNSLAFVPVVDVAVSPGSNPAQTILARHPAQPNDPPHHEFCRSTIANKDGASAMLLWYPAQGNWGTDTAKGILTPLLEGNYITLSAIQTNPLSVGSVHISSAQPNEKPVIDTKYLSHELDIEILARQVQFLDVVANTEPFASVLKKHGRHSTLYEEMWGKGTLDEVKAYVRKTAISEWHLVGTCAMLPREKGGVVDKELRVYGTRNLRVVDASVMPSIPRANTQTTVYAVAEKAADLIKADW